MSPGSTGRGGAGEGAGGPDSLVEVGLGLLTLDGGREGVDGFVGAEHRGVPHGVVGLPQEHRQGHHRPQQQSHPQV